MQNRISDKIGDWSARMSAARVLVKTDEPVFLRSWLRYNVCYKLVLAGCEWRAEARDGLG